MSSSFRAWIAAASVGAVKALRDQAVARWSYAFRSLQQQGRSHSGSLSQAKRLSSWVESSAKGKGGEEKMGQSEESLRKVMYLSCWAPS